MKTKRRVKNQHLNRRVSAGIRQRVKYTYKNVDLDDIELEAVEQDDNTQPDQATGDTPNNTLKNGVLPVTCGGEKGTLDVKKLNRGEACIYCKGFWLTPPAFEKFGGRDAMKNWKFAIFHEGKPLKVLFKEGSLTTVGFRSTRRKTTKLSKNKLKSHSAAANDEEEEDDCELYQYTEGEEERENGGKSEEQDGSADKDRDDSVEGKHTKSHLSACEESALKMEAKVVLERLPEFLKVQTDLKSNCMVLRDTGILHRPLVEDAENSATTGDLMKEKRQELDSCATQTNENKEDEQRQITADGVGSPVLLSVQHPSFADVNSNHVNETANTTSTGGEPSGISNSTVPFISNTDPGFLLYKGWEASAQAIPGGGFADLPLPQLKTVKVQTWNPGTVPPSDAAQFSGVDLDSMDLEQLKREKIKKKLKVLMLQEEYYTMKINKLKQ